MPTAIEPDASIEVFLCGFFAAVLFSVSSDSRMGALGSPNRLIRVARTLWVRPQQRNHNRFGRVVLQGEVQRKTLGAIRLADGLRVRTQQLQQCIFGRIW